MSIVQADGDTRAFEAGLAAWRAEPDRKNADGRLLKRSRPMARGLGAIWDSLIADDPDREVDPDEWLENGWRVYRRLRDHVRTLNAPPSAG